MRLRTGMRKLAGSSAYALAVCLLPTLTTAAADGAACFDDIEQSYQWDDGGFHWNAMPDRCPGSSQPASPADRKWGGSVQIRASGQDATVIEEAYSWAPKRNSDSGGCPRFFKTVTRRTRVAKGGMLYETRQTDDGQTQRSQRALRPNEQIYISNIQTVPKPGNPFVQILGNDTIAGQPCQRVASQAVVAGAGSYEMCIFVAPVNCPSARYLQPLELATKGPDGKSIWHGKTTSLRYGGRGQVVPPDSIRAP
jgi:hypothetical protein